MKIKLKYVGREVLAEAFHTSLRKCCDSKPTSEAWRTIQKMHGSWGIFLDWMHSKVKKCASPEAAAQVMFDLLRDGEMDPDYMNRALYERYLTLSPVGRRKWIKLANSLERFTIEDWEGALAFCWSGESPECAS